MFFKCLESKLSKENRKRNKKREWALRLKRVSVKCWTESKIALTPFMRKPLIKRMRRHQHSINWKSQVMLLLWQPKHRKKHLLLRSQMCTTQNFLKMQKNLPSMINFRILNIKSRRLQLTTWLRPTKVVPNNTIKSNGWMNWHLIKRSS